MFSVNRQEYQEMHGLGDDDPVPAVEVGSNLYEIQQELDNQDEACFIRTAAQFFLHEITLEDYFDRLIGHLEAGAVRHAFDKAKLTKLDDLFRVDLISGAVKSLMLNRSFRRLQVADATKLKRLCELTYRIEDVEELRQEAAAAETPLETLPVRWVDILAVIAYSRRHVAVLQHLVTYPAPSAKSTFDLLGRNVISQRLGRATNLQHSNTDTMLIEIKLWTILLQAEGRWIHYPLTAGTNGLWAGLHWLLKGFRREPQLRASPEVEELCRIYRDIGLIPRVDTVARFLSITPGGQVGFPDGIIPCGLPAATMLLTYFPLSNVAATNSENKGGRLGKSESAHIILPLTQWGAQNPDRLIVMRMLLEQGCDPNDKASYGLWTEFMTARQSDTALHLAAELGDEGMVDLLLEFGARADLTGGDGEGDTPASRARAHGHPQIAARIEG